MTCAYNKLRKSV